MHDALQSHLAGIIRQMALALPEIRWVDPWSIHLTLAFLGELTDEQVAQAIEATVMAAQQAQSFFYGLSHLGTFGSSHFPRVIWMGIEEPSGALAAIHHTLHQQLRQHSFAIDPRPFTPHLTLARLKSPLTQQQQQRLQVLLAKKSSALVPANFSIVHHLDVMKSELLQSGARYTRLRSCPLRKN